MVVLIELATRTFKTKQPIALSYISQFHMVSSQESAKIKPSLFNHGATTTNSNILVSLQQCPQDLSAGSACERAVHHLRSEWSDSMMFGLVTETIKTPLQHIGHESITGDKVFQGHGHKTSQDSVQLTRNKLTTRANASFKVSDMSDRH